MAKIEVQGESDEVMYFVGNREIAKPQLIKEHVGNYVAVSVSGLGGVKHLFTADDVKHIQQMEIIETPKWARSNGEFVCK